MSTKAWIARSEINRLRRTRNPALRDAQRAARRLCAWARTLADIERAFSRAFEGLGL